MALIRCTECGNTISDQAPACIHCGYPLDSDDEYTNTYAVQLRTYQTPFVLDDFNAEGGLSNRFAITDIEFYVEGDSLIIDIEGKKIYQAADVRWSQTSLNWTLIAPDRTESWGYKNLVDLFVGESFDIHIDELIFESGTYTLKFDIG